MIKDKVEKIFFFIVRSWKALDIRIQLSKEYRTLSNPHQVMKRYRASLSTA